MIKVNGKKIDLDLAKSDLTKYIVLIVLGIITFCPFIIPMQEISLDSADSTVQLRNLFWLTVSGILYIIIAIICLINIHSKEELERKNSLYLILMKQQKAYYEELLAGDTETKKIRHDIMKHLNYIEECINKEGIDQARHYIIQLTGKVNEFKNPLSTGNTALDIVTAQTLREFKEVKIVWEGRFPILTKMEEIEICILFGNLLENAAFAAKHSEKEKEVKVSCKILETNVYIQIVNPMKNGNYIKFKGGCPLTTKSKSGHGFGTMNIIEIVKKYHGEIFFNIKDNFVVDLILQDIITERLPEIL